MTPDERTLLTRFLDELAQARGQAKDQEADGLIHQTLAANPDAAYLLVQHAIVADQSLHAAQARIAELEAQLRDAQSRLDQSRLDQAHPDQPAAAPPSFLPQSGRDPWGRSGQPMSSPLPQDYAPPPPQQRPGFLSADSGLGSFLRSAGTTAAGVAGGEMLFSGLSGMFGHHGGGLFGGGQDYDRPEEVVINNYGDGGDRDDGNDYSGDDQGNW